jgi:hypothetical protein
MAIPDFDVLDQKLNKRGFRVTDSYLHECPACKTRAVLKYTIGGRTGGRDISLCQHCGHAESWRSDAGLEARVADPSFDLRKFLG